MARGGCGSRGGVEVGVDTVPVSPSRGGRSTGRGGSVHQGETQWVCVGTEWTRRGSADPYRAPPGRTDEQAKGVSVTHPVLVSDTAN